MRRVADVERIRGGACPRHVFVLGAQRLLPRFSMELAKVALTDQAISASISISRQNMSFRSFEGFGSALFPVTTFETRWGAFFNFVASAQVIAALKARLRADGTTAVIDLMPHIWSPIIAPAIKSMVCAMCRSFTMQTRIPVIEQRWSSVGSTVLSTLLIS